MSMIFSISVIIPVYNSELFIEKAIKSVIIQPEVTEIVLINDGSTDNSLAIIQKLQQIDNRIKIYHHKNKSNKGRSASRNLGIKKATQPYIAFLDADDFYLSNRFENDLKVFRDDINCDGVYNAVGFYFYRKVTDNEKKTFTLYSVIEKINPDFLFEALLSGKKGHFQINGLTVKKTVFDIVGFFNESLIVAEDTDIFWKMAIKTRLVTGLIEQPVALRGIHEDNSFTMSELYKEYFIKMYKSLISWSSKSNVSYSKIDLLLKWLWLLKEKENNTLLKDSYYWVLLFFPNPKILFSILSVKYFPLVRFRKKLFSFIYK